MTEEHKKQEMEANLFALYLLMPEPLIEPYFKKVKADLSDNKWAKDLADKFGVSIPALIYRFQLWCKKHGYDQ